jgi:hypothetical protein
MRRSYYQSVGNPVQLDRLPPTQPETEFLAPLPKSSTIASQILALLGLAAGVAFVAMIVSWTAATVWLEPYDLIFGVSSVIAGLVASVFTKQLQWLLHPIVLAGVGVLCLNYQTPWIVHVAVASGTMGVLVYAIGRHGIAVCLASPVPRETRESVRDRLYAQLLMMSLLAALLTAMTLWFNSIVFKLALITLPLSVFVASHPIGAHSNRWHELLQCLASWFTYDARPLPGLLQSPAGPLTNRLAITIFAAAMTAVILVRWSDSPIPQITDIAWEHHQSTSNELNARAAGKFEHLRYSFLNWGLAFAAIASFPVVIPLALATSFATPMVLEAAEQRDTATSKTNSIASVIADLQRSPDLTERNSIFLGRVVADGSPVLVPRKVFQEHAHVLGDSGAGKTSLFLCPIIEQLASQGECSIIVIDLKSDTNELLASELAAAKIIEEQWGTPILVKVFSNQSDRPTFALNPLTQTFWSELDLLTQTDLLCGAIGVTYGNGYGESYYSSANGANVYHALKTFRNVQTVAELAEGIGYVVANAKKQELHPEIRRAGVHVHEVMKRLAACEPLNVTNSTGHDSTAVKNAIDLAQVFQVPQLLYFQLSATLSPSAAPEIARLVTYMLLAAATKTERRHPVYVVIDEFQRMVAANLEYMLQLARSLGVGIILANQSMEDLKKSTTNLIPAIEANCRLRQWFSVSSSDDQLRLINSSGLTVDRLLKRTVSTSSDGKRSVSYSETETIVPRLSINDVLQTSDHPFRSFLRLSRGEGYAQYGGMPVTVESGYHITREEYCRRKNIPWPDLPGMFQPKQVSPHSKSVDATVDAKIAKGPIWTHEIIEKDSAQFSDDDLQSLADLYRQFEGMNPTSQRQ